MRSLGWVLIPQDWCPYKKRRSGHRHTQRDDPVRTQGGEGRLHAQERGLGRDQPCRHLDFEFPASRTGDNTCLLFKPPHPWHYAMEPTGHECTHALAIPGLDTVSLSPGVYNADENHGCLPQGIWFMVVVFFFFFHFQLRFIIFKSFQGLF